MSSPPEPSFRETPRKTTTFVVNSCEKIGVPRSADPFSKSGNKVLRPPYRPEKGNVFDKPRAEPSLLGICRGEKTTANSQRISNESFAQPLEILLFSLFATRRESTGNISANQTLNLIPPHNLTLSNFLCIFVSNLTILRRYG